MKGYVGFLKQGLSQQVEFGDSLEPQSLEFRVVIEDTEPWEGGW